ncbi:MAG: hypothetical protein QHH24_03730 [Candidatus Bathyarchaeota archaeon]|nr:hypothetical protein [Candidatus Bathyarchaeota archaeon]
MRTIEVYIKSEEKLKPFADGDYSVYDAHPCWAKYNVEKHLSSTDREALEALITAAKEKGFRVRTYDIKTRKGRLIAALKGIKNVPATVVGNRKTDGIPAKEKLLELL